MSYNHFYDAQVSLAVATILNWVGSKRFTAVISFSLTQNIIAPRLRQRVIMLHRAAGFFYKPGGPKSLTFYKRTELSGFSLTALTVNASQVLE